VTPNLTALETAPAEDVYGALIAPGFDAYVATPFEEKWPKPSGPRSILASISCQRSSSE
jgi:hypothetical protein